MSKLTGDAYREKIEGFGEVTLASMSRRLQQKKEYVQRERERLNEKERRFDEQMEIVAEELDRVREESDAGAD